LGSEYVRAAARSAEKGEDGARTALPLNPPLIAYYVSQRGPSVRHTLLPYQSGVSYDHGIFAVGSLKDSTVSGSVKLFQKFERDHPDYGLFCILHILDILERP